jgi:GMP reductase
VKALSYQDVYLIPRLGILPSRSQADLSVSFLGCKLKAPWIPANMQSVVNPTICKWLSQNDYPYIYHRFSDTYAFLRQANVEQWKLISISIGVGPSDQYLLLRAINEGLRIDWLTIDIAHGHSTKMKEMLAFVRELGMPTKVIAGNVATPEAVHDLAAWGADAVKVGIGGGAVCSTKTQTGFHTPMFTCVQECVNFGGCGGRRNVAYGGDGSRNKATIPIIADGGVREPGDIAKALVAGASLVMAGALFAACEDAPGENILTTCNGETVEAKRYHGSASQYQKGHSRHVEGFQVDLLCNGMTYAEKYQELTEALSSAVSYGGGTDLSCFRDVQYTEVSR